MARPVWFLLPAAVLAVIVAYVLYARPLDELGASGPPVETLAVESTRLTPGAIALTVRADGSAPVRIAQVQVDGAYRTFDLRPPAPISRLGEATVVIPYHWVEGEAHHIVLVTSTGATFEHTIEVAQPTPRLDGDSLLRLTLVGLLLGLAPIATGMLAFPAMRRLGPTGLQFLLAVTAGLLIFLFIDTLREGLEAGAEALGRLRGETAVWVSAGLAAIVLLAVGRWNGRTPEGAALAFFIALGIGLHNLGEGLAVGAALSTGAAALATFLVVGFVIHNVTEGIGIAVPLVRADPTIALFALLAALAGLPAVLGVWAGSQAVNPYWVALCFGIGAGAILQVVIEVTALAARSGGARALGRPAYAGGVALGLVVMYATALLV